MPKLLFRALGVFALAAGCGGNGASGGSAGSAKAPSCGPLMYILDDTCRPLEIGAMADASLVDASASVVGARAPDGESADATSAEAVPLDAPAALDAARGPCTYAAPDGRAQPEGGPPVPWAVSSDSLIRAIARDPDGNIVATGFQGPSLYVARFDALGRLLWSKKLGSGAAGNAVAADATGAVWIAGNTTKNSAATIDFGGGALPPGGFLVKLGPGGDFVLQKSYPMDETGASFLWPSGLSVLSSGDIVLTGSLQGTVDLGGGPVTSTTGMSVLLARYAPCGNHVFSHQYPSKAWSYSYGVAVDAADEMVITGVFEGWIDFGGGQLDSPATIGWDTFAAKFDSMGKPLASRQFNASDVDAVPGLPAIDPVGNTVLIGQFRQTIDFGGGPLAPTPNGDASTLMRRTGYVAKLGPNLEYLWAKRFGNATADVEPLAASIDSSGNVVITGSIGGSVDFDSIHLNGASIGPRLFVARLDSSGLALAADVAGGLDSVGVGVVTTGASDVVLGATLYGGAFALGPAAFTSNASGVVMMFAP